MGGFTLSDWLVKFRRKMTGKFISARELPIIAQIATAGPDDIRQCEEARMTGFLSKPIRYEQLIQNLLGGCEQRNSTPTTRNPASARSARQRRKAGSVAPMRTMPPP